MTKANLSNWRQRFKMKVTIVDLDWYSKKSFVPNAKCMKIASYYKQQQAIVNFATNSYELRMDYDKMYVIRENFINGGIPEEIKLLDDKVILIGSGLKFYDRYQEDIDSVMAACRPDYQLYPLTEKNKMSKADVVQFFYNDKLLPQIQDYHSTYHKKHNTYVVDRKFWEYNEADIEKCCEKLKKDKNIYFSGGLDLNIIFQSKNKTKMLQKLNINWKDTKIIWKKDNEENLFNFIKGIKNFSSIKIEIPIEYKYDHFNNSSGMFRDFYEWLKFAVECRKRRIHIRFISPNRLLSPWWFYFESLECWSIYGVYKSYVEYMLYWALNNHNIAIGQLLNNTKYWDDSVYLLMYLYKDYGEMIENLGFVHWGEEKYKKIDLERVAKKLLRKGEK